MKFYKQNAIVILWSISIVVVLPISTFSDPITNNQDFLEQLSEYQKANTRTSYMNVILILSEDGSVQYTNEILKTIPKEAPEDISILTHFKFNENDTYDKITVYDLTGKTFLSEVTELNDDCDNQYIIHLSKKEILVCKKPSNREIHLKLDIIIDPEDSLAICRIEGKLKDIVFKNVHLNLGISDHPYRFSIKEFGGENVKLTIPSGLNSDVPLDSKFTPIKENDLDGFKAEFIIPHLPNKFFTIDTHMKGKLIDFTQAENRNSILRYVSLSILIPSIILSFVYRLRKHTVIDRKFLGKIVNTLMSILIGSLITNTFHFAIDLEHLSPIKLLSPLIISLIGLVVSALIMHSSKKRR